MKLQGEWRAPLQSGGGPTRFAAILDNPLAPFYGTARQIPMALGAWRGLGNTPAMNRQEISNMLPSQPLTHGKSDRLLAQGQRR